MANENTYEGSYFCGAVRDAVTGEPAEMGGSGDTLPE